MPVSKTIQRLKHFLQAVFPIGLLVTGDIRIAHAQHDSSHILKKIIISAEKKQNVFKATVPVQSFNHETLESVNAESIADAAKYFSGVLIKDYGGVGGLKTISARS